MNCISCGTEHSSKYCPECGEKADTDPITFSSMLGSALSTLSNMDRGFLYNVKHLTIRPQGLVDDYLNGRRKGIFNPISFIIIVVTLFLIWDAANRKSSEVTSADASYDAGHRTAQFILTYFKYFWMLTVVWLGLATKIMFGKLNLAEHFATSAFIIGQATLASFMVSLIYPMTIVANPFVYLVMAILVFRVFKRKDVSIPVGLIKTLVVMLLFGIQLFVTTMVIVVVVNGLDAARQIMQG